MADRLITASAASNTCEAALGVTSHQVANVAPDCDGRPQISLNKNIWNMARSQSIFQTLPSAVRG